MSQVYLKRGNSWTPTEGNFEKKPVLDEGIYEILVNPFNMELSFRKTAEEFNFGFKLYGIDETLIKHVLDTYNKQPVKRNIGVLLNGGKGTGKTVTAKLIANRLGLPVIICDKPYPGLTNFLARIEQDCVFFFDEFEKQFRVNDCNINSTNSDENRAGEDLLSIMDGVFNTDNCHIFLLTTNELSINDNLLSRPSRIRYLKSYGTVMDKKILEEFIDDNLQYPEFRTEILDFVDSLTMATIDIVKTIVDEVNIHHCHIEEFKQFFNVKEANYNYFTRERTYIYGQEITKEEFLKKCNSCNYNDDTRPKYSSMTINKNIHKFKVGDYLYGYDKILELDLKNQFIKIQNDNYRYEVTYIYIENMNAKPNVYNDYNPYYDY